MEEKRKNDYVCNTCDKESRVYSDVNECPKCKVKYWNKPVCERDLLTMQDKYLENKDQNYFSRLIELCTPLIRNIIVNKLRTGGKFVSDEELEDMTYDTILKLIKYYKDPKKDFFISDSFTGYIQQMVLGPLYSPKKKERENREISFEAVVKKSRGKSITIGQMVENSESVEFSEEYMMNKWQEDVQLNAITDFFDGVVCQAFQESKSIRKAIRVINLLKAYIIGTSEKTQANIKDAYKNNDITSYVEALKSTLYSMIKSEIIDERLYTQFLKYKEDMKKWEKKQEEKKAENRPPVPTTEREVFQNIIDFGYSPKLERV